MAAIGTVLIVVGAVVLLGGLGYTYMAWRDQEQNDEGVFTNPERGQDNKGKAYLGFYVAGGGLLLAILGVALNVGGRRSAGGTA
jgi:hypothetical protein